MQICHAVEHIHFSGFAHLDLKLNNIFLDEYFNIKIGDFGSAHKCEKKDRCRHRRGTQNYMAPEVQQLSGRKSFDARKADVYSLGVILFLLLFKCFPKRSSVKTGCPFTLSKSVWETKSPQVRDLLVKLLQEKPSKRPSIEEVCGHDWMLDYSPGIENTCYNLMDGIRCSLPQKMPQLDSFPFKKRSTGPETPEERPHNSGSTNVGFP